MSSTLNHHTAHANPAIRMAIVSSGFGLLLSAAVLSGTFVMHQQAHQPSLSTEIRRIRGVSTLDLDAEDTAPDSVSRDATILASQAAMQKREMLDMQTAQPSPATHHHDRGSI